MCLKIQWKAPFCGIFPGEKVQRFFAEHFSFPRCFLLAFCISFPLCSYRPNLAITMADDSHMDVEENEEGPQEIPAPEVVSKYQTAAGIANRMCFSFMCYTDVC
jgi:hypothetical protein